MQRIKHGKEPTLHVHRYIVTVGRTVKKKWETKFHYCTNKKEVKQVRDNAKKGSVVEVYSATHNFREAWEI